LVEAKRAQIATEHSVNMNSASSHYLKNYLTKVVFIKKNKNSMRIILL
jgi:hypothetical protein